MNEYKAKVLLNKKISDGLFELVLNVKNKKKIIPGQFCMISVDDSSHLLRRPFSIFKVSKNKISILYKVVGEGTYILSKKQKNDNLSILLPLGNGFDVDLVKDKYLYIVAGGIGFASVFSLLNVKAKRTKFFYGVKTFSELYDFKTSKEVFISTDDGSKGRRGLVHKQVIKELKKDIKKILENDIYIYSCGPVQMLANLYSSVREISKKVNIYFSLEERMACGIGVCSGCIVNINGENKRVCKDGPVFNADNIIWREGE